MEDDEVEHEPTPSTAELIDLFNEACSTLEACADALIHTTEAYERVRYCVDRPQAVTDTAELPATAGGLAEAALELAGECRSRFRELVYAHRSLALAYVGTVAEVNGDVRWSTAFADVMARTASALWRHDSVFGRGA